MAFINISGNDEDLYNERDMLAARLKSRAEYNSTINSPENQAILNEYDENAQRQLQAVAGTDAMMGTNNYAKAVGEVQQARGQLSRRIAGQGVAQAAQADQQYFQYQQQALNERIARRQQQRQNVANAAGGLIESGLSLVGTAIGGPVGGMVGKTAGKVVKNAIK